MENIDTISRLISLYPTYGKSGDQLADYTADFAEKFSGMDETLLSSAADEWVRENNKMPTVADLRKAAGKVAKLARDESEYVWRQLVHRKFELSQALRNGEFDADEWEELAHRMELSGMPHSAAALRDKAGHYADIVAEAVCLPF